MGPHIRTYRAPDEQAVRRICFDTALLGQPMAPYFGDSQLVTDALLSYYIRFEPESLFVAEADGQVAGYLSGCLDTHRFEVLYRRYVLPRIAWRWLLRRHWLRRNAWDLLFASARHARAWEASRQDLLHTYPAHLHMNLDARFRGQGVGGRLLEAFTEHARGQRSAGIHLSAESEGGKVFFLKAGFAKIRTYQGPSFAGLPPVEVWIMGRQLTGRAVRGTDAGGAK